MDCGPLVVGTVTNRRITLANDSLCNLSFKLHLTQNISGPYADEDLYQDALGRCSSYLARIGIISQYVFVCMYACVCVYVYVCMYICVCMYIYMYIYVCISEYVCVGMYVHVCVWLSRRAQPLSCDSRPYCWMMVLDLKTSVIQMIHQAGVVCTVKQPHVNGIHD